MKDEKWNRDNPMKRASDERVAAKGTPDVQPTEDSGDGKSRRQAELTGGLKLTGGQAIIIRRQEFAWSQEDLSWNSGVSTTQIGRIERGECIPSMSTIERLETALDMELYSLFLKQKREESRLQRDRKRNSRDAIDRFGEKLVQTGLDEKDMEGVLSEALRSAKNLSKRKKSN